MLRPVAVLEPCGNWFRRALLQVAQKFDVGTTGTEVSANYMLGFRKGIGAWIWSSDQNTLSARRSRRVTWYVRQLVFPCVRFRATSGPERHVQTRSPKTDNYDQLAGHEPGGLLCRAWCIADPRHRLEAGMQPLIYHISMVHGGLSIGCKGEAAIIRTRARHGRCDASLVGMGGRCVRLCHRHGPGGGTVR